MSSRARQITIGVACFLVILVDGYDTTSIAFVAPALIAEWGISPVSLTPTFMMTSLGAVVGYLACGPLAARWGSRRVIIASVVWFSLCSLLTALVDSITVLAALRFITAVGLGAAVPTAIALASNHAPERLRAGMTIAVATGLPMGSAFGATLGSILIAEYGWPSVFIVGGVVPLLLMPALMLVLPESEQLGHGQEAGNAPRIDRPVASIRSLFSASFATSTGFIWAIAFLNFLNTYAFLFWLPTLLASSGFAPSQASLGAATFGFGGVLGNLAMLFVAARFGTQQLLAAAGLLAVVCMLLLAHADAAENVALLLIGGIGAGLTAGCVGPAALSVAIYPTGLRTTGIGCAAALGRIGSIGGPALGGALLAAGWGVDSIITFGILPSIAAIVIVLRLQRSTARLSA